MKKFLDLKDISSYKTSYELSNYVWDIIVTWNFFAKDTIGKQFAKSIDSISASIAEGFGRYYKKEKIQFYRYSYGSIKESQDWNEKAKHRNLLTEEQYNFIATALQNLPKDVHSLIHYTEIKLTI